MMTDLRDGKTLANHAGEDVVYFSMTRHGLRLPSAD